MRVGHKINQMGILPKILIGVAFLIFGVISFSLFGIWKAGGWAAVKNKILTTIHKVKTGGKDFPNPEGKTRGLRNNNPGNIIYTNGNDVGEIKPSGDDTFRQYKNMKDGVRAMFKLLAHYQTLSDVNSVSDAYAKWAALPHDSLNLQNFGKYCRDFGVDPAQSLRYASLWKVGHAVVGFENSRLFPDSNSMIEGYKEAFGLAPEVGS